MLMVWGSSLAEEAARITPHRGGKVEILAQNWKRVAFSCLLGLIGRLLCCQRAMI
jgi:hypothetical protein